VSIEPWDYFKPAGSTAPPLGMDAYLAAIPGAEKAAGLPPGALKGVLAGESTAPGITSSAGAITPFQITAPAAQDIGTSMDAIAKTPAIAAHTSAQYLAKMLKQFGNLKDAYAAYNAGPGGALKWVAAGRPKDGFGGVGSYVDRAGKAAGIQVAQADTGTQSDAGNVEPWDYFKPATPDEAPPPSGGGPANLAALGPDAAVGSVLPPAAPAGGGDLQNIGPMTLTAAEQGAGGLIGLPRIFDNPNPATVADIYSRLGPGAKKRMQATANMPILNLLPTAQQATNFITKQVGNTPYAAQSAPGRVYQGGVRGAIAGLPFGLASAGYGAISGVGSQEAQEAGLPPWAQMAAGVALPLAAGGLPALVRAGVKPLTSAGQSALAQGVIERTATNPAAAIEPPPVPMPTTLGQATNDPGLLALERTVQMRSPENQGAFNNIRQEQQQAVNTKLASLGNYPGAEGGASVAQMQDASLRGTTALQGAYDAAKKNENLLWRAVDPTNKAAIDTTPIVNSAKLYLAGLTRARSSLIPTDINALVATIKPQESLAELQDIRSAMLSKARGLRLTDDNAANAVEGLAKAFGGPLDNIPMPDPKMAARYQAARQATIQLHDQFGDQITSGVMAKNAQGLPVVPPSQVLGRYLNGTPEGLTSYLRVTGFSPDAVQAAKDYMIAGLKKSAETTQPIAGGGYALSASQYTKFLAKNQALFSDSRLFSPAERDILQRSGTALDFMERAARAGIKGGSDTYAKIAGGKYLEPLLGKKALAFLKLSAAVGGTYTHGIPGGVAGYMAADRVAALYSGAAQKIMGLVDAAVKDPVAAAQLRAFSATPNNATLTPLVRQLLGIGAATATNGGAR
jgi:hypothetical protein